MNTLASTSTAPATRAECTHTIQATIASFSLCSGLQISAIYPRRPYNVPNTSVSGPPAREPERRYIDLKVTRHDKQLCMPFNQGGTPAPTKRVSKKRPDRVGKMLEICGRLTLCRKS